MREKGVTNRENSTQIYISKQEKKGVQSFFLQEVSYLNDMKMKQKKRKKRRKSR